MYNKGKNITQACNLHCAMHEVPHAGQQKKYHISRCLMASILPTIKQKRSLLTSLPECQQTSPFDMNRVHISVRNSVGIVWNCWCVDGSRTNDFLRSDKYCVPQSKSWNFATSILRCLAPAVVKTTFPPVGFDRPEDHPYLSLHHNNLYLLFDLY